MIEDNLQEVPFDMSRETLKSIREWIDTITRLSVGIVSGQKVEPNEMIILKHKMVRQLIVLSSPLLGDNLEEIENFFSDIIIINGDIRNGSGWIRGVPIYTYDVDCKLDECVQGIQEALKKYFIPTIKRGEKY